MEGATQESKQSDRTDYYIRTPDREDSRGPFDVAKLVTLAEADQITENTLYYDDDKEEWMPLGHNAALTEQVFPKRGRLSLRSKEPPPAPKEKAKKKKDAADEASKVDVDELLAAADAATDDTAHLKKKAVSFEKAAALGTTGIGLMMLLSGAALLLPHGALLQQFLMEKTPSMVLNYPFILIGLFDLLMALFLFLAVTEVYPLLRGRAMLTLGFGGYLGWATGEPIVIAAAVAAGLGIFLATITRRYTTMIGALLLGVGGTGYMAYLAFSGDFGGYFDAVHFDIIAPK